MYWIVWSFDVKPEQVKAFERVYSPEGDWAQLFQRAPGFEGMELRRGCMTEAETKIGDFETTREP